jgi:hypothetical protein
LANTFSLRSEYDIPKPHDPELLDMWDYVYEGKDALDKRYREPKSYQELGEYVEGLRVWRCRAFKLLDFGWGNDDSDSLSD